MTPIRRAPLRQKAACALALIVLLALAAGAKDGAMISAKIDPKNAFFAIVTHKAGLAKGLAHNHLIHASRFQASFSYHPTSPHKSHFSMRIPVDGLVADDQEQRKKWSPFFQQKRILEEAFQFISDADRTKVRRGMLAKDQLHAKKYPYIKLRLLGVSSQKKSRHGYDKSLKMAFTIRGKRHVCSMDAKLRRKGRRLFVEALGETTFSAFGIKPESVFLGAIRNKDQLHLFTRFQALLSSKPGSSG